MKIKAFYVLILDSGLPLMDGVGFPEIYKSEMSASEAKHFYGEGVVKKYNSLLHGENPVIR